jgi:hypothetical protein
MSEEDIKKNLIELIDEKNSMCFNESKEKNLLNMLNNSTYLESSTDPQLLIFFTFRVRCLLKYIQFKVKNEGYN